MKTKTLYGHQYTWHEELGFWFNELGDGRPVFIFPPTRERESWWVLSPTTQSFIELTEEHAEYRAFSVAAGLISQE